MEPKDGFEPPTRCLQNSRFTAELFGHEDETTKITERVIAHFVGLPYPIPEGSHGVAYYRSDWPRGKEQKIVWRKTTYFRVLGSTDELWAEIEREREE